jgi:methanogenic corrinoid protein MtbC1
MSTVPQLSINIQSLRDDAVSAVADALYTHHPDLAKRFGPRGVKACREDLHHHLDYLDGALETGETSLFNDYATWLKQVLHSRGVPSAHLAESFALLADFFRRTLPAADAGQVGAILDAAREALLQDGLPAPFIHARVPALVEAPRYRQVALSGNHRAADALMSAAMDSGCTLSEAAVRLVQPAMYDIGRLWQENHITVAQEHLATSISQNVLAHAYMRGEFAPSVGRTVVFAAVAGNHHCLGLRMLSDAFETIGWDALYLGANVPVTDLIRQTDASGPDLLCLSLALPAQLAVARETVERLKVELGNRCPTIWVGGLATLLGERVWRSIKADGWAADALHALEQA